MNTLIIFHCVVFYPGVLLMHWESIWESIVCQVLFRCNFMVGLNLMILFFVHNSIKFDMIANTTDWLICSSIPWQKLHHVLQMPENSTFDFFSPQDQNIQLEFNIKDHRWGLHTWMYIDLWKVLLILCMIIYFWGKMITQSISAVQHVIKAITKQSLILSKQ